MMQQQPMPKAKTPYTEPEIIPPGADWPRASRIWVSTGPHHSTRITITRLGPVGIAFFALLIGILALAGMALLVGAALVGIAAGVVLIVGGSCPASRAVRFGDRRGADTRAGLPVGDTALPGVWANRALLDEGTMVRIHLPPAKSQL